MVNVQPAEEAPIRSRLEFAAKAFLITSFLGVLTAGALRLRERAIESSGHRIELGRWTVLDRPGWTTLDDVRSVRDASGLSRYHASLFDPGALATVDAYLARSPEVKRVAGVRRIWPNRIEAVLELRRPVVAVRVPGRTELFVEADEEAVALSAPKLGRPVREGTPLRIVTGSPGAAPRPGDRFGADVAAAAGLAASLDGYSDDKGRATLAWLDRIDVSNYGGRVRPGASEVLLFASPPVAPPATTLPKVVRGVVEWGRAGERETAGGEMPFDAKASRVLQALRLFPRLEGIKMVRVAFNDLVIVPDASPPEALKRALEIDGGVQAK